MITTIAVDETTKGELIREAGQLQRVEGRNVSMDEMIRELIKFWRSKR